MGDFTDNPTIAALLNASGLGGLTSSPTSSSPIGGLARPQGNPLAPQQQQAAPTQMASAAPPPKPGKSAPNQPEYRQARFFDPKAPPGQQQPTGGGSMPTEPGALSPDVQSNPTVMDLLNHFGVHPQQEIDPGLFIHNANAWKNHPVMSGVLDGLMSGLANTQGGHTVGESISNVAKGLETTHDQQIAHINAQLMMPYTQAMTVAQLQDQVEGQKYKQDEDAKNRAQARMYDATPGIQAAHDAAHVAVQQERTRGLLARQQMVSSTLNKLPDPQKDTYQKSYQNRLDKLSSGRDVTQPGNEITDEEKAIASEGALQDAVVTPKVSTAVDISNKTQANKVALKGAAPGSSTAAMISAGKNSDPVAKAAYADADKDVQAWQRMKAVEKGAALGKPFVIPGGPEDTAEMKRRVSVRDAARTKLAPSSKYSSNNPYAPSK